MEILLLIMPYLECVTYLNASIANKQIFTASDERQKILSHFPKYELNKKLEIQIKNFMVSGRWDKIFIKIKDPSIIDKKFLKSWALNTYKLKIIKVCLYKITANCGCIVEYQHKHKRYKHFKKSNCLHPGKNVEYKVSYHLKYYKALLSYI